MMCTAMSFNGYFGRTLDYECGFGEEATVIPEGHPLEFRHRPPIVSRFAIGGMARTEKGYPLFFDGLNSAGLGMAGLNFVGNAHYSKGCEGSVAFFELIPFILSQAASVTEAEGLLEGLGISDTPFSKELPSASLHWMIADGERSIVIESTADGVAVYRNPVGVLTNNPPFPHQLTSLGYYLNLTASPATDRFGTGLEPISRGMGAIGLPGDWSSQSRFVRAAFVALNAERESSPLHFFRLMSAVAVPKGCIRLEGGEAEYTRYTSCMDLKNPAYYYQGYEDMTVRKIVLPSPI